MIPFMLGDVTHCEFQGIEEQTNQVLAKKLLAVLNKIPESEYVTIRETTQAKTRVKHSVCKGESISRNHNGETVQRFNAKI